MKVFLTGGSGYIGSAVALALKKAGHDVLALVRSEAKGEPLKKAGVKLAVGDLGNPAGYAGAAWGRAAFVNVAQDWSPQGPELDRKTIGSARDLLRALYPALIEGQLVDGEKSEGDGGVILEKSADSGDAFLV